jgi:hypothetical protein
MLYEKKSNTAAFLQSLFHCDPLLNQLQQIADNYRLTLPLLQNPESPSSITSQFQWLFNELHSMFWEAQCLQPARFDAQVVVLWDEYDSVIGNALLEHVEQSKSTELPPASSQLISSHLETLRGLASVVKGMQKNTRLFFVTGTSRLALAVRFTIGAF